MEISTTTIIQSFDALKIEFKNAERRLRKIEADNQQEYDDPLFTVPSTYIAGVWKQLEDFQQYWQRIECEERYSNVDNYQIFNHLLERTLYRLEIYFRVCDCQSRSDYLALIRHTRKIIATQYQLFERLYANVSNLDIDSQCLLNYAYELKNREINLEKKIAMASAERSRPLRNSFVSVKEKYPTHLLDHYLANCVEFHSHIQVYNLFENVDDFLNRIGFTIENNIVLQSEQRRILEYELNLFKIPLCISPKLFVRMTYGLSEESPSENIDVDNNQRFYPSKDPQILRNHEEVISVLETLRIHRWLVCLGEPGSRKTILAQYLTCCFAKHLQQRQYARIAIDGIELGPPRIPILIRIGEFVQWLEQHPTGGLIDYVGFNTWYGKRYSSDPILSEMLIDFVRNGHTLIIIDGLDEVATIHNRQRVVELVTNFIRIHTCSADFVSPFDKEYVGDASVFSSQYSNEDANVLADVLGADGYEDYFQSTLQQRQYQWQCESFFEGNLVMVTSRVAGYNTAPLSGDRITHCTIQPFSTDAVKDFVKTWCENVQIKVQSLISLAGFKTMLTRAHCWSQSENILAKLENLPYKGKMPTTNPLLLSTICVMYARQYSGLVMRTRIELYEEMVNLAILKWLANQMILSRHELRAILAHLAIYMQRRSSTGLIDEFDLGHLCFVTLKQLVKTNMELDSQSNLRRRTSEFIRLLNEDMGVAAARSLCVYGFIHLSFQEYFAALYLTERLDVFFTHRNLITLAKLFCQLFGQRRMQEVLLLAIGRISLKWLIFDYNRFCDYLVSARNGNIFNKYLPSGSILLLTALDDLARLPMASCIHKALDTLLHVQGHSDMIESCQNLLINAMSQLSSEIVHSWFEKVFHSDVTSRLKVLYFFWSMGHLGNLKELPKWFGAPICDLFSKQFGLITGKEGETIDFYIEKYLILTSTLEPLMLPNPTNGLKDYLIKHPTAVTRSHPRVLAAIIALFGGLRRPEEYVDDDERKKENTIITFSPQHMHRISSLSHLFIPYFDDESPTNEERKLQHLIDQCQLLLCKSTSTRFEIIHSYIILLSLLGIDEIVTRRLDLVIVEGIIRHVKLMLYYLRNFYCTSLYSGFKQYASNLIINKTRTTNDECMNINYAYLIANTSKQLTYFEERLLLEYSDAIGSKENVCPALGPFLLIPVLETIFKRPDVNHWGETMVLQFLNFVYCIPSRSSMSFDSLDDPIAEDICRFESGDLQLLKSMNHPFQILQSKPWILMLAFFPKHLQPLYKYLFLMNSPSFLPLPHLLIEFLFHSTDFEPYTLRFCILITVLLPVFQEHKMEHLLLAFIKQCNGDNTYLKSIGKETFCHPFTKILLKKQKNFISPQTTIEDAIEEERRRISIPSHLIDSCNQLYVSSICLARLTRALTNKTQMPRVALINEALIAAEKIENPLWRLDALLVINGCPDTTRFESRDLISTLETALMDSTSFMASVALIVRCLFTSESTFKPKRLFDKIFEQLHLQSDGEQQAICQALVHFPSLHVRVCRFINEKTKWTVDNNLDEFSRIFQLHSTTFASAFLTFNSCPLSYETLSASMYLAESAVDIIQLEKWLAEKMNASDTSLQPSYLTLSKLIEQCLHDLDQNESLVSTETIINLSTHFVYYAESSTLFTKEHQAHLQVLGRSLLSKRLEDVESARPFVLQWLKYDHHPVLFYCAHMGVVLLAQSSIRAPDIIEKCCEILISKEYCECPGKAAMIITRWLKSDETLLEIILKCLIKEEYAEHLPVHLQKNLHEELVMQSSHDLALLVFAERHKHQIILKQQNAHRSQWSLFDLIDRWPTDAPKYFMDVFSSFKDPAESSFLMRLLEHLPMKIILKSSERETFRNYLLSILNDNLVHVSLTEVVVRCLSYYQEDPQIRTALWNIIIRINNNPSKDGNIVAIACLRSLYWRRQTELNEEELQQLDRLRKSSMSSCELQEAALTALYMHIIKEPTYYCVLEVYFSYMRNIGNHEKDNATAERASDWIICHRSVLLTRFIEDLYKFMTQIWTDFPSYIYVADLVCGKMKDEFCDTIRQSVIGENAFKNALCLACRTNWIENNEYIVHCVQVYACFQEFTCDYASMLLKLTEEELSARLSSIIPLLLIDREVIEYLLSVVHSTSSSHCERFRAAQILLHLEQQGYVSIVEIQETIVDAIENLGLDDDQSDYDLKWLLSQQMLDDWYNPEAFPKISVANVTPLMVTPCSAAPAIVFLQSNIDQ